MRVRRTHSATVAVNAAETDQNQDIDVVPQQKPRVTALNDEEFKVERMLLLLKKANLKDANLSGANLTGTKLTGAIMPDGTTHE